MTGSVSRCEASRSGSTGMWPFRQRFPGPDCPSRPEAGQNAAAGLQQRAEPGASHLGCSPATVQAWIYLCVCQAALFTAAAPSGPAWGAWFAPPAAPAHLPGGSYLRRRGLLNNFGALGVSGCGPHVQALTRSTAKPHCNSQRQASLEASDSAGASTAAAVSLDPWRPIVFG